jgi:uncharacterized protein (DUF2062 family)
MCSFANIRSHVRQILHLHESPHRTALAFAVGAFIAFSPTYFFHTVTVVFCTWAFRLNFLALMAGALINNPWTLVPILSATFWTGFRLLGMPDVPPLRWEDLGLRSLYDQILPYAVPFFVGGFVLSVLAAVVAYPLAYVFIAQYRARIRLASREPGPLPPQTDLR